ncbi:MAG: response regulator [Elusimicrobiota bacterium]
MEENKKTLLIITKDKSLLKEINRLFENKQTDILHGKGQEEVFNLTGENKIDLLILDTENDSSEICEMLEKLKETPETESLPVVVLAEKNIEKKSQNILESGADELFIKPVDKERFPEKVKNIININKEKTPFIKSKKAKVLIADDEQSLVELVKDTLESCEPGYDLVSARNGQEALDKIYSERPDIVILDVKMPEMNGYEVCEKIREDVLMRNLPILMLTVDKSQESEIKGLKLGVDDYLTKPFKPAVLVARVRSALSRVEQGLSVNPLTYLPGNSAVVKEIEGRIKEKNDYAVLYCDLDRFKAYNDYYGFHRGDEVIKATARVIVNAVKKFDMISGFVGHIGGDDFIAVISDKKIVPVCREIIKKFDDLIPTLYDEEDRQKGYIKTLDRKGQEEKFEIMTMSIGVVTTREKTFSHVGEISKIGSELKRYAKKENKSNFVVDRRKD